ncbi:hypothetical protein ACWCXH_35480 [Kitasatospora sp. NPDC001660]
MHRHLPVETLADTADLLARHQYGKKHTSELSRYFNGQRVPPWTFVRWLYRLARTMVGAEVITVGEDELRRLHNQAESTLCRVCPQLRSERAELRQERDNLRAEVDRLRDQEAGSLALKEAEPRQAAPLPVPAAQGDRQRSAHEVLVALEFTDRAEQLADEGDLVSVAGLFQQVSEVLSPVESAAALVLLRQRQQDHLAENLIQIYARDQPDGAVIQAALALHDYGYPGDAGMVLRVATSARAGTDAS